MAQNFFLSVRSSEIGLVWGRTQGEISDYRKKSSFIADFENVSKKNYELHIALLQEYVIILK